MQTRPSQPGVANPSVATESPDGGVSARKLRVVVSSVNFAPDHAGIGVYSTDFPVFLAEQGDDVTMVTGFSYYPRWLKRAEDVGRLFRSEVFRRVRVLRGYLYVPRNVTTIKRLIHETTFAFFALLNFLRARRPDVIVVFTPPFFLGGVGVLMKWLWRRPLVINIQDLPLDAALALKMLKRNILFRYLQPIEAWIYRQADLVVTISPDMLKNVRAKGVLRERSLLCPNWIDVEAAGKPATAGKFLRNHEAARGKFTVAYAGNIGIKQGIDALLRAAKEVETENDVHLFVIGDGADKDRLLALHAELGLRCVTFVPFLGPEEYREMLTDVDAVFVAQRSGAGNNFFPSKLLGVMAQAKPLLVAADRDSELAKVIAESGCGLVSAYGQPEELAANIRRMKSIGRDALRSMGQQGVRRVKAFDRSEVLGSWRSVIEQLVTARLRGEKHRVAEAENAVSGG